MARILVKRGAQPNEARCCSPRSRRSSSTGVALADPLDPKVAYMPADVARAKAIVLMQSDLGRRLDEPHLGARPRSLKAPVCPSLRPDYSKLTLTGHAESVFDNGNGGVQIVSDVEIWKNEKQAKQHMDALLKPALPKCIKYSLAEVASAAPTSVLLLRSRSRSSATLGDVERRATARRSATRSASRP